MMEHKGYSAKVEFDDEAKILHGEVLGIRDVITFQAASVEELEKEFHASVDDYLAFCEELGEPPEKPMSGNFPVRATPELHSEIAKAAQKEGVSLNAWVITQLSACVQPRESHFKPRRKSTKPPTKESNRAASKANKTPKSRSSM
jgi:predicted HicB family RNase H-like nuclease